MGTFVKKLVGEKGFSVIELLAALTLFSLISGVIYATITFGFDAYYKVNIEGSLRDEGDLVMSTIISQLYEYAPDNVQILGNGVDNLNGVILNKNVYRNGELRKVIKIANDALFINDLDSAASNTPNVNPFVIKSTIDGLNSKITLDCNGITQCSSGIIQIKLVLTQTFKNKVQKLELDSKFGF
ncbi:PulJ/GspJ family protein [Paenibacillus psychroresistens]|uniref:PulJ/GspJ family protein n=1 Tax=Paenibacillus psychroresistens TaxID=1778678 RepID=UPI001390D3BC|nr:prepilin-type N-terminal cleavage/methylation domain-containing protein [Paenibacillus psychroresistens]